MAMRSLILALLLLLANGGALAKRPGPAERRAEHEAMPLLELYQSAYSWGAVAFSCVPAVYPGGTQRPGFETMRRKLGDRLGRARARLAAAYGEAPLAEIERAHDEEEHGIYRTGCDENASPVGRARYRRLIELLERRTAGLPAGRP
ncbi:MAG TPA: hypothetical protein VF759_06060 [Allosphingosinicella sp.]|jgi:hypothetical protein